MQQPAFGQDVWKSPDLVQTFLEGVRGGIPWAADQIAVMLRVVRGTDVPVRRFLDLGSGAGALASAMVGSFPNAAAVLADHSPPMLEAARSRFGESPHALVLADFGAPDWVEAVEAWAPFDAVVSGYAIHHQPDTRKRAIYAEILPLLTPGAAFVNVEHVAPASSWIAELNNELFIDSLTAHHDQMGTGKSRAEVARDYVHRPDKEANLLAPVEVQCAWLRDCGYVDVDCFFKVFELAVFGGRRPA